MRSCYSSTWRFPGGRLVKGQFWFNDEGEPYPGLTYFTSADWHRGDGTEWPKFGELQHARRKWRDGSFPATKPDAITLGTRAQVEGEADMPTMPFPLIMGIPSPCWPDGEPFEECPGGGEADDGTAFVTDGMSGGDANDGTATVYQVSVISSGGEADDGTATVYQVSVISSGGEADDGSEASPANHVYTAVGGDADDGSSTTGANHVYTAVGGDADDGAATGEVSSAAFPCPSMPSTLTALVSAPGYAIHLTTFSVHLVGGEYVGTTSACSGATVTGRLFVVSPGVSAKFELLVNGVGPTNFALPDCSHNALYAYFMTGALGGCGGFMDGFVYISW